MDTIRDMSNTYIEHSMIINNFVICVGNQLKSSTCRVFGDSVKYKWAENGNVPVVPDVSINCDTKNRRATNFLSVPRFIMEVLSPSTEKYDRQGKMELYRKMEVEEYWIVDWRLRQVEIYILVPEEDTLDGSHYDMTKVDESCKEKLYIRTFPHVKITWDELFNM